MLITKGNSAELGVRKRTLNRMVRIGPLSLKFITLIIFAAIALFYLAQTTQSATTNYKIRELKLQKETLLQENQRLAIEAVRLQTLKEISKGFEGLGLENTQKLE